MTISLLIPLLTIPLLPLLIQSQHYHGSDSVVWWIAHFRGAFCCNVLVAGFAFLCLYPVVNSTFLATLGVTAMSLLFIIIDRQKMRILNQPLLPGDLLFIRQAVTIARLYAAPAIGSLIPALMLFAALFAIRKRVIHFSLRFPARMVLAVLIAAVLAGLHARLPGVVTALNHRFSLVDEYWNQLSNYRKNGALYGFVMNMQSLAIPKPALYSKPVVNALFAPYTGTSVSKTTIPVQDRPDVIVCLSESFWDITAISPVPLPCDPISRFREICRNGSSIRLVSPVFGGNTCNAEFEILTGMPHGFFPPGVMAYNQYICRSIPSLVREFKENGYRTTGIHTFKGWFWNRLNVYRHLGFDAFISEESMKHPELKGIYISDNELAERIIERASVNGRPDFIFALSMQNHGPYEKQRYTSLDCPVSTGLSEKADCEFNAYLQGLIDADRSLDMLTRYVDTVKTPTLLVFFGDHLPGFAHVYKETGAAAGIARDTLWGHTTTAVWYANYPLDTLPDTLVNMFYLPLFIAERAHLPASTYYRYLDSIRKGHPVLRIGGETDTGTGADVKEQLRLCVYDVLFGRQYSSRFHHPATSGE